MEDDVKEDYANSNPNPYAKDVIISDVKEDYANSNPNPYAKDVIISNVKEDTFHWRPSLGSLSSHEPEDTFRWRPSPWLGMTKHSEIKSRTGKEVAIDADEKSYSRKRKYTEALERIKKMDVLYEMAENIDMGQKLNAEDMDSFRGLKEESLHSNERETIKDSLRLLEPPERKAQRKLEARRRMLERWKEEIKFLKRRSDFVHLILSYPMKPGAEEESQPCLGSKFSIINQKIRNFEAHYESHQEVNYEEIEKLLKEVRENLVKYDWHVAPYSHPTPKSEPAELIKPSTNTKSENASRPYEDDMWSGAPEVMRKLAINSAVEQISEYFEVRRFGKIGISGSGWEEVVKALLEDLPKIRNKFVVVQRFSLSQLQTIVGLVAQIRRTSEISVSPHQSTRLLLLIDCIDQQMDLHDLLDFVDDDVCIVLTIRPHNVNDMMAVDLEIRMEDHLLPWNLFCKNVGRVLDHSSALYETAIRLVEKCNRHLLAIILLARALKDDARNASDWELALQGLMWQPSSHVEGMNVAMINVLRFIWERMGTRAKKWVECFLLHGGKEFYKHLEIQHAVTNAWIETEDEVEHIIEQLTISFLLENVYGSHFRMREETRVVLLNIFIPGKDPGILKQENLGLTKTPKAKKWVVTEIHLMNNKLSELPESPNCHFLVKLLLQGNYDLRVIPPSFFECMPILQELNLSKTSIKSLPKSISKLVALQKFFLKFCDLLMELPPEIGALTNLEVFDLEGTEIMYLPKEIGEIVKLTKLRVFFNECANLCKKNKDGKAVVPKMALSNLSRLSELSIEVHPHGDWWDVELRAIIHELRNLKSLTTLKLYLPVVELLKELRSFFMYPILKSFQFIVGRHEQRFISRLPHEVKEEFNNYEKGLKYINGEGKEIPAEITKVLNQANAFFLERHWTVKNLSEFGFENMKKLEFCCLVECNEFRTIIDVGGEGDEFEHYSAFDEEIVLGEEDEDDESEHNSDIVEEIVLGSLQYLSFHYMKNMESIWKGPVRKDSLYRLKSLALHTCPKLTTIFTLAMLHNLRNLKELIVEDCPKINSLVSFEGSSLKSDQLLPGLKKISLLELPELASISSGLCIAPKLESMVIFYCPKLKMLSMMEVSSKNLKVIKGESEWWDSLKWQYGLDHHDYLASKFISLRMDRDLLAQLTTDQINSNLQGNVESYISG